MKKAIKKASLKKANSVKLLGSIKEIRQLFNNYRKEFITSQKTLNALNNRIAKAITQLEAEDKLGNFEIQDLMATLNQAETLASSILKKRDDTGKAIIGKI